MCWALSITVPGATYLQLFPHRSPGHLPFRATHVPILEMRKTKAQTKSDRAGMNLGSGYKLWIHKQD